MNEDSKVLAPLTATELKSHRHQDTKSKHTPIMPVPGDAPELNNKNQLVSDYNQKFRLPKPSKTYRYHDQNGNLLGFILRWDITAEDGTVKKEIRPFLYCECSDGKRNWLSCGFPEPRPLYNLHKIMADKDKLILITEGEKAVDASQILFPDMVCTTTMHGAQSPHKADWSPLKDRNVVVSPDSDGPGKQYADEVYKLAKAAGAKSIQLLSPSIFGEYAIENGQIIESKRELKVGYDLADAVEQGWTAEYIGQLKAIFQQEGRFFFTEYPEPLIVEVEVEAETCTYQLPDGFRENARWIEYKNYKKDQSANEFECEWKRLCSFLLITACTRNEQGEDWGRTMKIVDSDGIEKEYVMPMELLAGNGDEMRKNLLSLGLLLAPGLEARKKLEVYISLADPKVRATCVKKVGWFKHHYVLPNKVYGKTDGERVVLQGQGPTIEHKSSLAEWKDNIGQYIIGNSILTVASCAALAAPFLTLLNEENFAIHLSGSSSIGKTTAARVACSIWGIKIHSWRTTDNAAESMARDSNDGLLVFDELGEVDAKAADNMAYMLGNGSGKGRSNRNGEARPVTTFRTVILSTGEVGLEAKLNESGKSQKAGQSVRFIEIRAEVEHGIYEELHGFATGDQFSLHFKNATEQYCGVVMDELLTYLTQNKEVKESAVKTVETLRQLWVKTFVRSDANGQTQRCGRKFGLLAAVGEIATFIGLLPKHPEDENLSETNLGQLSNLINDRFQVWVAQHGGEESHELREISSRIKSFIQEHGSSRFENAWKKNENGGIEGPSEQKIINRAGFKKFESNIEDDIEKGVWHYYFLPDVFEKEILKGKDKRTFLKQLVSKGLLVGNDSRNTQSLYVPGCGKNVRVICVNPKILEGGTDHADGL
jgi:putative DNA primase/helicase